MEPDHTPSFFTTMVDSPMMVTIPQMFSPFLKEDFSNTATLVGPSGDTWIIKVKRTNSHIKLKGGWKKFCKDNSIGPIDVLLFSYEGCMRFRVQIFEPSGMKKKIEPKLASPAASPFAGKNNHDPFLKQSKKAENAGQGNSSSGDDTVEVDKYLTDPRNPCFETEIRETIKGNKLFFPKRFLREHGVELAKDITYSDPTGRELIGKVGVWGDGRVYVTGWKSFVNCNRLELGDKCIIELVLPQNSAVEKKCCHMNVHFVPPRT